MRFIPADALSLAVRFEGIRNAPYLCPAGVPTIGVGATRYVSGRPVSMHDAPISTEQAMSLLKHDMQSAVSAAIRICPVLAAESDSRLAAIADFVFNLGAGRLQASTLRRRVNQRAWVDAAHEIRRWNKGGGRVLSGLVARREAEARLLING